MENDVGVIVTIQRVEQTTPYSKLADAEVHFVVGELDGLKLVGFGVWPRRDDRGYMVTFPARPYKVHGQRRYFTLLRSVGRSGAESEIRRLIVDAYLAAEGQATADAVSD